ncbi:MAG: DUF3375 domain-containing protein [Propionicimonas sp.]
MVDGSVVPLASALRRIHDDPASQLLRADNMPAIVAILHEHLGGTQRVKPAHEFMEQLSEDLAELRGAGFDLPRSAQEYLGEWVRQGLVVRRPGEGREETVELSPSAQQAVRFVAGLNTPRSAVTSSRLSNVVDMLERLARLTDPGKDSRLDALHRERERLDAEIAAVAEGRFEPLPDDIALERVAEVLRLAGEIPGDFARVGADFEKLNRELREQIIKQAGARGDVLAEVFSGVDLIEESDAGRTFSAFFALVLNPEVAGALDEAVDSVLNRDFADALTQQEAFLLRHLLTTLQSESTQVRAVMTGFSRSLRRFVETREYREHRRLAGALDAAKAVALQAVSHTRPLTPLVHALGTSSFPMSSLGTWKLRNPADARTVAPVAEQASGVLDLEALRRQVRESEIDFAELRAAVVDTLRRQPIATVGDVLAQHPATQGLASIVGFLVLAHSVGSRASGSETLSWVSARQRPRSVRVRRYLFTEIPPEWKVAG